MSYVSIEVHASEVTNQLSEDDLLREIKLRKIKHLSKKEMENTILNISDYCRSQGRNDYAFRLDEIRSELF